MQSSTDLEGDWAEWLESSTSLVSADWWRFIEFVSINHQPLDVSSEVIDEILHQNGTLLLALGVVCRTQRETQAANQRWDLRIENDPMQNGSVIGYTARQHIEVLLDVRETYVSAIIQANWWVFKRPASVLAQ
jgi:hypothetical protein